MKNIIVIILSSTVLSTIITSFVTILINKKSISLQYITNERKEWREEIRILAEEINKSSSFNISDKLVKLKVRINAFGWHETGFLNDSHIWHTINQLENPKNDMEFNECKKALIDYLSFMLKYDWERSKEEIRGNKRLINKILINIVIFSMFTFLYVFVWKLQYNDNYYGIIAGLLFVGTYSPAYYYFEKLNGNKTEHLIKFWIKYILFVVIFLVIAVINFIPIYNTVYKIDKNIINEIALVVLILFLGIYNSIEISFSKHKLMTNYVNILIKRRNEFDHIIYKQR